ncbi:ABC transporter ATP-binding protein [Mariprofundus aestuarium]|nr:ABC transporter ATP-binding protein [Mariprofundus aestuarium]
MSNDALILINELEVAFPQPSGLGKVLRGLFHRGTQSQGVKKMRALKGVDLEFSSGERVGIVGHNGAGKSTLLKCMAGIYPPTKGRVEIIGSLIPLLELGAGFSMSMTVQDNIYLNGAILGLAKSEMKEMERDILDFSGLDDYKEHQLIHLSSGMRSRLGFSIASFLAPDILLLDEVFATGDASFVNKAKERMNKMIDRCEILVIVSHQESIIRDVCSRTIVLDHGTVKFDGDTDAALSEYQAIVKGAV